MGKAITLAVDREQVHCCIMQLLASQPLCRSAHLTITAIEAAVVSLILLSTLLILPLLLPPLLLLLLPPSCLACADVERLAAAVAQ